MYVAGSDFHLLSYNLPRDLARQGHVSYCHRRNRHLGIAAVDRIEHNVGPDGS
jgi:hypothetical protein